ncbi:MAG: hypothetical protein C4526_04725 [Nitrospiraceae bacterium]|nr:MAG: hypothetical protein C4526_04725 [Nitrospiraceae bacterium]
MKRILLINLLLSIFLAAPAAYGKERVLNVLYTGSLQGELEPCGCSPKTDFGGLARLSGYLKENKKKLSPNILIDAGNFSGEDTPQGRLKTETLLKAYGIIGYDAVAFGKREAVFREDFLSHVSKKNRIRAVYDSPHYTKSIMTKKDKLNIHLGTNPERYEKGKVNILLSDTDISDAETIKGWDVIILSSGEEIEEPLKANGTIIISGSQRGKKLGILTLRFDNAGNIKDYRHRWQPLGSDIREDKAVRSVLNDYDLRVARLFKEDIKPLTEAKYLGVEKCAECHQPFVESWKKTKHAGAFSSLERVGKSFDPECVICHAVGFGEGGFYNMEATPGLAGVQCEVCHGAGREHLPVMEKPLQPVTEPVCLKCHTKDRSPDFSYESYREKITH